MNIQMTKTIQGSLDGVTVRELVGGEQYDTVDSARGERLARYHVKQGVAVFAPAAVEPVMLPPPVSLKRVKKAK